jgi:hypothetical protein
MSERRGVTAPVGKAASTPAADPLILQLAAALARAAAKRQREAESRPEPQR